MATIEKKALNDSSGSSQHAKSGSDDAGSSSYVNQWNRLVSTTNWEKGRIICQWRESLKNEQAAATDGSDEAWAQLVGGVTGQHVGRLRRVYEKFGATWEEYPGLFWSHFQVAIEWDDAEMWLEGAVQNGWSVSKMRAARWEAHGAPADLKPSDADIVVAEVNEDITAESLAPLRETTATVRDVAGEEDDRAGEEAAAPARRNKRPAEEAVEANTESVRPFADLPELPDDIADAFEQFKLAILTHKMAGWQEISRDDLLASLDALKELASLPAE